MIHAPIPDAALAAILDTYVCKIQTLSEKLVSVIHFGSTARGPLKRETDIDLLLIFEKLPDSPFKRSQLVEDIEILSLNELKLALPPDYHLYFSSKLKTVEESNRFNLLYLDMVDHSKILYDPSGHAASLLAKTKAWIEEVGAYRVEKGLKWYWVLGDGITWNQEHPIGW